jgi:DHA2 family multidrug resistance protein
MSVNVHQTLVGSIRNGFIWENLIKFLTQTKSNAYIGSLGVFLGTGIATLSLRLVSVGLPDNRAGMGLGVDEAAWIPTAFNMALMFMGPFSVYFGGLLGTRRVLLFAGSIFIFCSLLLPLSPNLEVMLTLQVISGLAAGTFYPLTLTYALRSLPTSVTIFAIGAYSLDVLALSDLAVPLEAWLTDCLSWRWIFWFGTLLTPIMMLCVHVAIPHPPERSGPAPKISWIGFFLFSSALCLIYGALDQGERLDWLNSNVIVCMFIAAVLLIAATVICRRMMPNPLVNIQFLFKRNTLVLAFILFSFRFVLLAVVYLIPSYLGAIHGYLPLQTGTVLLWAVIPQLGAGGIAALLMRRLDGRVVLATGLGFVLLACLMNAQLTSAWIGDNFWLSQLVISTGLSFAFVGLVGLIVQQALETRALTQPINVLTYAAFMHGVRLLGGEIGSSFLIWMVTMREKFHSSVLVDYVNSSNLLSQDRLMSLSGAFYSSSHTYQDAKVRALSVLASQVRAQAYTIAYIDGFLVIATVAGIAILALSLMKPMKIYYDSPPASLS